MGATQVRKTQTEDAASEVSVMAIRRRKDAVAFRDAFSLDPDVTAYMPLRHRRSVGVVAAGDVTENTLLGMLALDCRRRGGGQF